MACFSDFVGRASKPAMPRGLGSPRHKFWNICPQVLRSRGQRDTCMTERSVSIFYPCYNDWGSMGSMVLLSVQTARRLGLDFDITIVDDGSGGHMLELLDEIEQRFPEVRVARHEANRARQWRHLCRDDGQDPPRRVPARRGPRPSLSAFPREIPALQLPAHCADTED